AASTFPNRKLRPSGVSRDLCELLLPRWKVLSLGLALVCVNRAAGLVLPASTKYLVDDVVLRHQPNLLWPIAGAVGAAVAIQAITSFSLVQLLSVSAQALITDMRIRLQQHIGRLPVVYHDGHKAGALAPRILTDVEGLRNIVGAGLVELVGGIMTASIAFLLLLRINVRLTMLAV